MGAKNLYEEDFFAWVNHNINLIKNDKKSKVDFNNLLQELTWMSKKERKALRTRLIILMAHMLKWDFQPNYRCRSWYLTIKEQRLSLKEIIQESPSLHQEISKIIIEEFERVVALAMEETRLRRDSFPHEPIYSEEDVFEKPYEMPEY